MRHVTDVCSRCDAEERCAECFGSGNAHDDPAQTCMGCGGSGEESPQFASCPQDGCAESGREARR